MRSYKCRSKCEGCYIVAGLYLVWNYPLYELYPPLIALSVGDKLIMFYPYF